MSYITIIGAANMDLSAKSYQPIIPQDSNPSRITKSHGGVGRNIGENLARLGADVKLIAPVGDDGFGRELLDGCEAVGIDTRCCYRSEHMPSQTYIAVLDEQGEMFVAAVDMACVLPISHMKIHADTIAGSDIILLETNLEQDMIAYILDHFSQNDLYVDPISVTKAQKIKHLLGRFHTIKMNRLEAETLTDMVINSEADLRQAGDYFLAQGTRRVIISLGAEGLYYRTESEEIRLYATPMTPINATGAGDALMAGIAFCSLYGKSDSYTASFAQAAAQVALLSEYTVNPQMDAQEVMWRMEQK